jgi:hypothetical protein
VNKQESGCLPAYNVNIQREALSGLQIPLSWQIVPSSDVADPEAKALGDSAQ